MINFDNNGGFLTGTNYEEDTKPKVRPEKQKDIQVLTKHKEKPYQEPRKQVNRSSYIKKNPSKLPGIKTESSKPKLMNAKSSINFYKHPEKQYTNKVHNYLSNKQLAMTKNKNDFKELEHPFTQTVTSEFLQARKQKIQDSMVRLYENDKAKIIDKLNRLEKQNVFKTEVVRLEDCLEDVKKQHNEIQYKIAKLTKLEQSHLNTLTAFEQKHNVGRDLKDIDVLDDMNCDTQNNLNDKAFINEQ